MPPSSESLSQHCKRPDWARNEVSVMEELAATCRVRDHLRAERDALRAALLEIADVYRDSTLTNAAAQDKTSEIVADALGRERASDD